MSTPEGPISGGTSGTPTPPATGRSSAAPVPTSRRTPLLPRWASGPSPRAPQREVAVDAHSAIQRWFLIAIALLFAWLSFRTFAEIGGPLLLAAWMAHLFRPLYRRVVKSFAGRERAAAVLTVGLFLALVLPLAAATITLVSGARELVTVLLKSEGGKGALEALVSKGGSGETKLSYGDLPALLKEYGSSAYSALASVATVSVEVVLALFVFYAGFFALLVRGLRTHAWVLRHAPISPRAVTRLLRAFQEAGRGLLVGTGLTALIQGSLATVAYLVLGVPRALVLGLLTAIASLIPSVGTAIIWLPVAAGFALTDNVAKAVILASFGFGVIGLSDNLLRPWLSHSAHLEVDSSLILLAMLGGIGAFGPIGLFVGPLVVRMAVEALAIAREANVFRRREEGADER